MYSYLLGPAKVLQLPVEWPVWDGRLCGLLTCRKTVVRDTGIEPVTSSVSGKRSPAELIARVFMEVETGIEPVCTALQAVASPLGHSTARDACLPLRADDGIRTRDPHLGKVMRYQLRYIRAQRMRSSPGAS